MTSPDPLSDRLTRDLDRRVVAAQREWKVPGVSAGVVREGELVWSSHVGSARLAPSRTGTDDTQFMIGSVTKTFTALLVLQLRDEGKLELDAPLGTWLPRTRHAAVTVRQMLAHSSGLQREPVGHLWESLDAPDAKRLLRELEEAERPLGAHFAFHYSNLAYALLGQVVEKVDGDWEKSVTKRLLKPLGLSRTGLKPSRDRAKGYQVDPFAGTATEEPVFDLKATAPLGGLWSTVTDLARYAAFVADPAAAGVMEPDSVDEMCRPIIMVDQESWGAAYGLGFGMTRRGDRVLVGHGGAMPGFLTGLQVRRSDKVGAVVSANGSAHAEPSTLAADLVTAVLDEQPTAAQAWVPEARHTDLEELLGPWWSEGGELRLEVREGALWMGLPGVGAMGDTRFARESELTFRAVEGRERGELLEIVHADDGSIAKLYFATYAVTRRPLAFADLAD